MKDVEFLGCGLRLLGLFLILKSIQMAGNGLISLGQYDQVTMGIDTTLFGLSIWFPVAITFLASIFLMMFPVSLAKWCLPRSSADTKDIDFSDATLVISGSVLMGIYVLSRAVPDLAYNVLFLYQQYSLDPHNNHHISETMIRALVTVIEIGIGVYLVIGSKSLFRLVNQLRGRLVTPSS